MIENFYNTSLLSPDHFYCKSITITLIHIVVCVQKYILNIFLINNKIYFHTLEIVKHINLTNLF